MKEIGRSRNSGQNNQRRRSAAVRLILSGSLVTAGLCGCDSDGNSEAAAVETGPTMTNNTYNPAFGYWHAPYHHWYPLPYNYYRPGQGYYHGGAWTPTSHQSDITASRALSSSRSAGGVSSSSSGGGHISRGGFGGHSVGAGS